MKLQDLVIIFLIIIIPIIFIFTVYLNQETETIMLQTDYDAKLIEATKEAVEAYEINTTEWNDQYHSLANVKRQNIMSSINVFTTSLADKLRIGGSSKESILTYVPAIVYTMYDGYYIYSPTYVPQTITNESGVQFFYYKDSGAEGSKITSSAIQNIGGTTVAGEPIFYYDSSIAGAIATGTHNGELFTTDSKYAKKIYKHVLKTFVPYTTTYNDYTINYTLDNYIRIYGNGVSKEGYLETDIITVPVHDIDNIIYDDQKMSTETLTENIYIKGNTEEQIYPYIYNSNNDKRYFDYSTGRFFTLNKDNERVYLTNTTVGHPLAEYKKLLVRTNTNGDYIELYQLLNSSAGDRTWYYKNSNNQYIRYNAYQPHVDIFKDCSAINYYVHTASFNMWLNRNGFNVDDILSKKKETIVKNINDNLNLSVSNYNANSKLNYRIFELKDEDWDQALSNISMITFFEGKKIGLKTYNNYAIVTSTQNNEYVSKDLLYFVRAAGDQYYHRMYCDQVTTNNIIGAYRNIDFKVQSYEKDGTINYYYKHGDIYECFDCIVNRNNFKKSILITRQSHFNMIYKKALARERFVQMSKTKLTRN